jgi:formamidopyrimidine-DNA glycosylase
VNRLFRAMRQAVEASIAGGGVHTLAVIAFRHEGRHCPRCGAPMLHGKVAGRTTWWCSREQKLTARQ